MENHIQLSNTLARLLDVLASFPYALQIYFDFSGYSMMGIGMGKMLGFDFPDNFNLPYISRSITEFWRRWHITLSSWFKEYVYIPLGGNRKGLTRQLFNIFGSMVPCQGFSARSKLELRLLGPLLLCAADD